jgi:hypothetical protein
MKRALSILLATGLVTGIVSSFGFPQAKDNEAFRQERQADKQAKSISVSELADQQVVGWLGHSLGKIVTIEGIVADQNYRRMKIDSGSLPLRVQRVNGKQLDKEQVFHFQSFQGAEVEKPRVGAKFKYTGYETGAFTGIPHEAFKYVPPMATTGYGFTTSFVILRDEAKRK